MRTVKIRPTQPQADFHAMTCKFPAFVGGFGTGKSETMANQAFMDASHSSDALIGLYEPTYDLIRLIMAPRIEEKLQQYGIRYKYNKSENIIYTSSTQFGDFILRTMDNPARIVGYETYRAHCDELDTLNEDKAREAWGKIIARNRQRPSGIVDPFNRVSAYSTPEGFRFMYKTWGRNPRQGYEMVRASSYTNPFLPPDYLESLKATYEPQVFDAYANGQFVNLTSGSVYCQFSRLHNHTTREWDGRESLHIGCDFNVGRMCSVTHVVDGDEPRAVDEITGGYDTPDMIRMIKQRYWKEIGNDEYERTCQINIYPDASGKNRKSVGASETDISLMRDAGFSVHVNMKNPAVKDRVNAMNAMLCNSKGERRYLVNTVKCPTYTEKLEQQIYKNGEPEKDGSEDVNDAGGYFIAYKYPIQKPIAHIPIAFNF